MPRNVPVHGNMPHAPLNRHPPYPEVMGTEKTVVCPIGTQPDTFIMKAKLCSQPSYCPLWDWTGEYCRGGLVSQQGANVAGFLQAGDGRAKVNLSARSGEQLDQFVDETDLETIFRTAFQAGGCFNLQVFT